MSIIKLKKGDKVEVTNSSKMEDIDYPNEDHVFWKPAIFFGYDDDSQYQYLVKRLYCEYVDAWRHCRRAEHGRYQFKVDDPVLVQDTPDGLWIRRHFSGWSLGGDIQCWPDGMTSFTVLNVLKEKPETWKYYKPFVR